MSNKGRKINTVKQSTKSRLRKCFSVWGKSDRDVLKTQLYIWFPCIFRLPKLDALQQAMVDITSQVLSKVNLTTIVTPNMELTGSHDRRTQHRNEIRASMKGEDVEFVSGVVPRSQKQGPSTCSSSFLSETQMEETLENLNFESKSEKETGVLNRSSESHCSNTLPERESSSCPLSIEIPLYSGKESKLLHEMYDSRRFHVPAWFVRLTTSETALQLVPFSLDRCFIHSEELKEMARVAGRLRLEVLHLNTTKEKYVHFAIAEECKRKSRSFAKRTPPEGKEEKEQRTAKEYNNTPTEPTAASLSASDESQVTALFEEERKLSFPYRWKRLKEDPRPRKNQNFKSGLRRRLTQIGLGWRGTRGNLATLALEARKFAQPRGPECQFQHGFPQCKQVANVTRVKKRKTHFTRRANANVSRNNSNGNPRNCMNNHFGMKSIQVQDSTDEDGDMKINQKILLTNAKVEAEQDGCEQQFFSLNMRVTQVNMLSSSKPVTGKANQYSGSLRTTNVCRDQIEKYFNIDTEKHRKITESKHVLIHKKDLSNCPEHEQNKSNSSNADVANLKDKAYVDDLSKEQRICSAKGLVSAAHTQPVFDLLAEVSPRKRTRTRKALRPSHKGAKYLPSYEGYPLSYTITDSSCTKESYSPIVGEPVKESAENILPVPCVKTHVLDQSSLTSFFQREQVEERNVERPEKLAEVVESIANFVRRRWKTDAFSNTKSQQFTSYSSDHVKQDKSETIMTTMQNPLIRLRENSRVYFRTINQKNESIPNKSQHQQDSLPSQNVEDASYSKADIQKRSKYTSNFQTTMNNTTQSKKNNGIQREDLTTDEIPFRSTKKPLYFQGFPNRRVERVSRWQKHGSVQDSIQLGSFLQKTHTISSVRSFIDETPRLSFQNNNDTPPPVEEESNTPLQDDVMNEVILGDHQAAGLLSHSNVPENDSQSKNQSIRSLKINAPLDNGNQYKNHSIKSVPLGIHQASGLVSQTAPSSNVIDIGGQSGNQSTIKSVPLGIHQASGLVSQTVPSSNVIDIGGQSGNQSIRSVEMRVAPDNRRQSNGQSIKSLHMYSNPDMLFQGTNLPQTSTAESTYAQTDAQRASLMFQSIMDALDILISREKARESTVQNNTLSKHEVPQQAFRGSAEANNLRRQTQLRTDTMSFGSDRTIKRDTQHDVPAPGPKRESYTYRHLQPCTFSRNRSISYRLNQDKSGTWRNNHRTDPCRAYLSDSKGDSCDGLRNMAAQEKTSVPEYARSPLHNCTDVGETLHNRLSYPVHTNAENAGTPGKDRPFTEAEACALAYINHVCNSGPPKCFEVAHKSMGCHREPDADKCMFGCRVNNSGLAEAEHQLKEPESKDVIEYPCVLKCQVPTSSVGKCFCPTSPSVQVCCEKARCATRHAECTKKKCSCRKLCSCSKAVQVDLKKCNAPNCRKSVSVCVQKVKTKPVCTTSAQTCLCLCNTIGKCKNGKSVMKTVPEPNTNKCCGLNTACNACSHCRINTEVCGQYTGNFERQRGVQTQREDDDTFPSTVTSCVTLHGEECCVKRMHNKKCQVGQPIICQNIGTKVGSSLTCSKMCSCTPREIRPKCIICKASKGISRGLSARVEACVESTPCNSQESAFSSPLIESASDCELPYGASLFLKNVARKKAMNNCRLHRVHCDEKSTSGKLCPNCEPGCRCKNICTDYKSQPCCQARAEEVVCEGLDGDKSVSPVMRIHYKSKRLPAKKPDCTSSTSWSDVASPNAILKDKISNLIEQSKEVTKQVQKMKGAFCKNHCGRRPCKVIQCQDDSNENKRHENKNTNAKEEREPESRAPAEVGKLHAVEKIKIKLNLYPMQYPFLLSPSGEICICGKNCSKIASDCIQFDQNNSNENKGGLDKKKVKKKESGETAPMQDSKHPNKCLERNRRHHVRHWLHRILNRRGLRSEKKFAMESNKKKELLDPPSMIDAGDRINQNQRRLTIKQTNTISTLLRPHKERNTTTAFLANRLCAKHTDKKQNFEIRSKVSHLPEQNMESEDSNASSHGIEELPFDHCSDEAESIPGALSQKNKKQGPEKYPNVEVKAKCKTPKTNKIQPVNHLSASTRDKKQVIPSTYSSKSSVISSDKEMAPTAKLNADMHCHKKCSYWHLGNIYGSSNSSFSVNKLNRKEGRSSLTENGVKGKRTTKLRSVDSFTDKHLLTPSACSIPKRNSSSVISVNHTITPRINRMRQSDLDEDRSRGVRKSDDCYSKPFGFMTFKELEEKQNRNMREGLQNSLIDWWNSPDCLKERAALATKAILKASQHDGAGEQEAKITKSKCSAIYQQNKAELKSSTTRQNMAQEHKSHCAIASLQKGKEITQKRKPLQIATSCAKTTTSSDRPLCYDCAYNPTHGDKGTTLPDIKKIDGQDFFVEKVLGEARSVSGVTREASSQLNCSPGADVTVKRNSKTSWFARHLGTAEVVEANELRVVLEGAYVIPSSSSKAGCRSQSTISAGHTDSNMGLDEKVYPKVHNSSSVFSNTDDSQYEPLGTFGLKSLPFRLVLLKRCLEGGSVLVHGTYMRKLISEEGAIKWTIKV